MKLPKRLKALINVLPIVVMAGLGVFVWSKYQASQAASGPDYENVDAAVEAMKPTGVMPSSEHWQVVSVADGDTLTVSFKGKKEKLRLCGIDAPEVAHGSKAGQPLGIEATEKLRSLVGNTGSEVIVVPIEQDRYGRTVTEVFVQKHNSEEETFVNGEMTRAGLAYHYSRYSDRCVNREAIERGEAIAKGKKVGA
jgi:endonuclease YncB( thermonuclease family)